MTHGPPSPGVVVLRGELDISTLPQAEAQIEAAEAATPEVLVIDLSALTFVDSSGVRVVLLADGRARASGRRIAVRLGDGPALRVFQALGLVDKLEIADAEPAGNGSVEGGSVEGSVP